MTQPNPTSVDAAVADCIAIADKAFVAGNERSTNRIAQIFERSCKLIGAGHRPTLERIAKRLPDPDMVRALLEDEHLTTEWLAARGACEARGASL